MNEIREVTVPKRRGRPVKADKNATSARVSFPDSLGNRLQEIQQQIHAASIAEVFRRSLILFAALLEARQRGDAIIIRNSDGKERYIDFLS